MSNILQINIDEMPTREQYTGRLLKAKAQFRSIFRSGNVNKKPRYASVLVSHYPDMQNRMADVYAALNDHSADWPILEKFEKLVFETIPQS